MWKESAVILRGKWGEMIKKRYVKQKTQIYTATRIQNTLVVLKMQISQTSVIEVRDLSEN